MIGFGEIVIVILIIVLIAVAGRRGGRPVGEPVIVVGSSTTRIPWFVVTVGGAVTSALGVVAAAEWRAWPPYLGALAAGVVAGLVATWLAHRGLPRA
ncbi:MAG: hypothetical protein VX453_01895 [Acidobacteriota bacterium]|nr:hypothetical protein [Acidobacteriota bacterium]